MGKTSFCALSSNRRHPPKTLLMVYTRKPLPELIQGLKIHKNYSCARNQFLCAIFQRMGSNERTINVLCMISPPRINSGTKNTKKIVLVEKPFYFATYATPVTRWGPTKSAHGLLTNTVPWINSGTKSTKKIILVGETRFKCLTPQYMRSAESTAHGLFNCTRPRINSGTKNSEKLYLWGKPVFLCKTAQRMGSWIIFLYF